jgi:hypothetical protein
VTELELKNQRDLMANAAAWGAEQVIQRATDITANAATRLYAAGERNGRLCGFWYGFAAGAFGVGVSLAVTWLIFS